MKFVIYATLIVLVISNSCQLVSAKPKTQRSSETNIEFFTAIMENQFGKEKVNNQEVTKIIKIYSLSQPNLEQQLKLIIRKRQIPRKSKLPAIIGGCLTRVAKYLDIKEDSAHLDYFIKTELKVVSRRIRRAITHILNNRRRYKNTNEFFEQCIEHNVYPCLGTLISQSLKKYLNFIQQPLIPPALFQEEENGNKPLTWKANPNSKFAQMTVQELIESKIGGDESFLDIEEILAKFTSENGRLITKPSNSDLELELLDLPDTYEYNLRKKYPKCILEPKYQGFCNCCWAFASVRMLQERLCIKNRKSIPRLSPQYLVSCFETTSGCQPSNMDRPVLELEVKGTVTDHCLPYHSVEGNFETCDQANICSYQKTYKFKRWSVRAIRGSEEAAIEELTKYGSLVGYMVVNQDFYGYQSGIYEHREGESLGGHAVTVIGFGQEDGIRYWICANSWGTDWGDNGFFKIRTGDSWSNYLWFAGDPIVADQNGNEIIHKQSFLNLEELLDI